MYNQTIVVRSLKTNVQPRQFIVKAKGMIGAQKIVSDEIQRLDGVNLIDATYNYTYKRTAKIKV